MVNEDDHINIRISTKLKQDLKMVLPMCGYSDFSAWVRACAIKTIEKYNSNENISSTSFDLDPEIRRKFFEMLNSQYGIILARHSKKKIMGLSLDFTADFYREYNIILLPIEVKMLIDQYYSGGYFSSEIRQAHEMYIRSLYNLDQTHDEEVKS